MHPFCDQINLHVAGRIAPEDAARQERTAREIPRRLADQPGVVLADEVGMGKTFVALAVAVSTALANRGRHPVVVMTPPALKEKWPADFALFKERCVPPALAKRLTFGTAERAEEFLKLLDDPRGRRKTILFVTHGAMSRGLNDPWVKLALVYRALRHRKDGSRIRRALARNHVIPSLLRWSQMYQVPEEAWLRFLQNPTSRWLHVLHSYEIDPEGDDDPTTDDDPVPRAIRQVLRTIGTDGLYAALQYVPLKQSENFKPRVAAARQQLSSEMRTAWRECVGRLRLKLPLLVLDEAHHLKNADTQLATLFRDQESQADADELQQRGVLYGVFQRMLFLTATPFQLGHAELCSVLERFDGIRWDGTSSLPGGREGFAERLRGLHEALDSAQESAVTLDHAWGRLRQDDLVVGNLPLPSGEVWWPALLASENRSARASEVVRCYQRAQEKLRIAEERLRPLGHSSPEATRPAAAEQWSCSKREADWQRHCR